MALVTIAPAEPAPLAPLHTKCASCVHICGQPYGGNGFCRIWNTVLSSSLSLPQHCPHWRGVPQPQSRSSG